MATRKLEVVLAGDSSSLERTLSTSGRAAGQFGTQVEGAARSASGAGNRFSALSSKLKSFGSRAMSAGRSMTAGLTLPLVGWGVLAFNELNAGAEAMAQTRAVIQSTGQAADRSAPQIARLAGSLSDVSSIDDEDIQGGLNVLLTFTRVSGDVFDDAAQAMTDMSVAMGTDLNAAALQVGKALNDPVRGLTALTRVGVTFTEEQREQIEAMVAFGDTAGAQRIILRELNREFGGSASAFGDTPAARLRRLKQRFEELGASILTNIMPVLEDVAGFVDTLADKFDNLTPTQQKWVSGLILAAAVIGPLTSGVGLLSSLLGGLVSVLGSVSVALGIGVGWIALIAAALIGLGIGIVYIIQHWDALKRGVQTAISFILDNVPGAQTVIIAIGQAVNGVAWIVRTLGAAARVVVNDLIALGSITFGALYDGLHAVYTGISSAVGAAAQLLSLLGSIAGSQAYAKAPVASPGSSMDSRDPNAFFIGRRPPRGGVSITNGSVRARPTITRPLPMPVIVAGNI